MPTTPPSITALPAPPDPSDRSTYNARAYPWSVAQQTLATELGAVAANVFANATDSADSAAVAAAASANAYYKGAWSALTGALPIPASVGHSGSIWMLLESVADVTAHEPGVSAAWQNLLESGPPSLLRSARTSNTMLTAADKGKLIDITSGTFSQTFDAVATLGDGWWCYLRNSGTGDVTLDPNAAETIDGVATKALDPGQTIIVQCDGAALRTVAIEGVGNHHVIVNTGNGHGSTNNKIRRFTTTQGSAGTAISYADSATLGSSFTINEPGIYEVMYADTRNASIPLFGISRNSAQLTTSIGDVTADSRLGVTHPPAGRFATLSVATRLAAGDVVRPHTDGTTDSTEIYVSFTIRKVGL